MRALIQRVREARVEVEGRLTGQIGIGILVLLGVAATDTEKDVDYLARRVAGLRIFPDETGKMNRSLLDMKGAALVVSQFTLYGDCRKGMRPSYDRAARPEHARRLYEYFIEQLGQAGIDVKTGIFQAHMEVYLVNDGPVTLICESDQSIVASSDKI